MINFSCPKCSKSYKVKDEFAGRQTTCQICKTKITVPLAEAVAISVMSMEEPVMVESVRTTKKECPFCNEEVNVNAKKCKHCGETIDVTLRVAEEANRRNSGSAGGGGNNVVIQQTEVSNSRSRSYSRYRCPYCETDMPPIFKSKISTVGWTLTACMFCFFPLNFLFMLMKEEVRVCPECNVKM